MNDHVTMTELKHPLAPGTIVKFGEMPWGTWFRECTRKIEEARIFVKLQTRILEDGEFNYFMQVNDASPKHKFNAVDSEGGRARCPDWLEFEVIENPFKKYVSQEKVNLVNPNR